MSERTMEKARQVVYRLSEWYFAEGGDNDPDSPIDREDLDALHDLVRTAEATAEMERRQAGAYADVAAVVRRELEAPGAGEDVRERVAREVFALDADWRRGYWDQFRRDCPRQAQAYYDTADRILGLCRAPRGEGEAEPVAWRVEYRRRGDGDARWYHLSTYTNEMDARERAKHAEGAMRVLECRIIPLYAAPAAAILRTPRGEEEAWRAFLDALDEFEAAANLWVDPEGPTAADMERLRQSRQRVIECARALAALRSEAQGDEADALDLIRWAESHHAALEPVAGNIMPPGTYACYAGDADDPYMGPGILGAIRAARRSEGGEA